MKFFLSLLILGLSFTTTCSQDKGKEISHYLFPDFTKGTILMKGGLKLEGYLNYNSLTEEMVFLKNGKKLAMTEAEMERTDTVYILDRKFFLQHGKFVELIHNTGYSLYAEHGCKINMPGKPAGYGGTSETQASDSYSSLLTNGTTYELQLPDGYKPMPYIIYWIRRGDALDKFVSLKQLLRLYPEKKESGKAYIREHKVDFDDTNAVVELINFLETD
jgi:hypothetical protein